MNPMGQFFSSFRPYFDRFRRFHFQILKQICLVCIEKLEDIRLATALADLYLLPNLDAADQTPWKELSTETVINAANHAYYNTGDLDKRLEICRLRLKHAYNRNTADGARECGWTLRIRVTA